MKAMLECEGRWEGAVMSIVAAKLGIWAAALSLLGISVASAGITFCSEFPASVWVAIAYPQDGGGWLSRGWLELAQGDCSTFDSAIHVSSFYYRGMSKPYRDAGGRRVIETWGNAKPFAVWERDNFQYYNAEERVLNSTLEGFSLGAENIADATNVTVTFKDGGTTVSLR
jgi:hypothetical protein